MNLLDNTTKWLVKLDKYSSYPVLFSLVMSAKEKKLFLRTIKDSKYYLEFGMGGSTIKVIQNSKAQVYSVESSSEWISHMRAYRLVRRMEKRKRLQVCYVNIGPTGKWGFPATNSFPDLFPPYSSSVFDITNNEKIDIVFIDGRFRIACTLKTIMECRQNSELKILIHDFWNRSIYHILLRYLEELESADTLGVFKIRKDVDLELVKNDYEQYKYNPF